VFPAWSLSFTVSFAVAFLPRFSAPAIRFACPFFLGFSFSVLVLPAPTWICFGLSSDDPPSPGAARSRPVALL
jgi:hypothetical protein